MRSANSDVTTKSLCLSVDKCPNNSLALTNHIFVSAADVRALATKHPLLPSNENYVQIKNFVYTLQSEKSIKNGLLALSSIQRRTLVLSLNENVEVYSYTPGSDNFYLQTITLEVDYLAKQKNVSTFEAEKIEEMLHRNFKNQFFTVDQLFVADQEGVTLKFQVSDLDVVDLETLASKGTIAEVNTPKTKPIRGLMTDKTDIIFKKASGANIKITGGSAASRHAAPIFRPDWNFERMGIGGLDEEFSQIFRRAFASRVFPPALVKKLGIQHVKGILLYGPPGTGKTLMARQIGKMLNGKEPKVVNGPEILNKYVGQSEENIRKLFEDAEKEFQSKGDDSDLHILIFDEIDAICSQRGTRGGGTGVADTVVNQLLSKIDGVEQLNNILIIGMTNRKDMIDEALLRPGRLEVHMEISLPDENGRLQIIKIHTNTMRTNGLMAPDVDLKVLAAQTKNFSGAEIEGLVKSATSFAFDRQIDARNPTKPIDPDKLHICAADFENALGEVKPTFGVSTDQFENTCPNGVINYGPAFEKVKGACELFIRQVLNSSRTPLLSVLLEGSSGCGKTALASYLGTNSGFPYVKLVSAEDLVGYTESGRQSKISRAFEDSYKSPLSVVLVDDIERLLDYVPIGQRFSNVILQTLLVYLKKQPPKGRKLVVFGTTSKRDVLEQMGFMEVFDAVLKIPNVSSGQECVKVLKELKSFSDGDLHAIAQRWNGQLPIKRLFMIAEMAVQGMNEGNLVDKFFTCLGEYGMDHLSLS